MAAPYCIFEFNFIEDDETIEYKIQSWLLEIPCSVEKVIDIYDNKISCINNLNENKSTLVKLCLLRPFDDFIYVDEDFYNNFESYEYLGRYKLDSKTFYVYYKIMGKKDVES